MNACERVVIREVGGFALKVVFAPNVFKLHLKQVNLWGLSATPYEYV